VFADTGGEHPETYCYLEYFGRWLAKHGLEITKLSPITHPHLYKDKRCKTTLEDYCLGYGIIPLLAVRWCSVVWNSQRATAREKRPNHPLSTD